MFRLVPAEPVDYLVIGHITVDLTSQGPRLGGTAAYSALTAYALGLRVGIVTSRGGELPLEQLERIPIANFPNEYSTTFENLDTPSGRLQFIKRVADRIEYFHIPEVWRRPTIVHLGPVAQEVEPAMIRNLSGSFIGVTPQGWLRSWDETGLVDRSDWPEAPFVLQHAGATVLSIDDVKSDESRIEEMVAYSHVLALTEGAEGVRVYWNGDVRRFKSPQLEVLDTVGAGDIFAAAFFSRLYSTRDPWEAGRFASHIAAFSVTRAGLASIPTVQEIQSCLAEVY